MNRTMKRMALPIGAAVILGSSSFAFMAKNTVETSLLGDGFAPIEPYNVTNVHYETDPRTAPGSGGPVDVITNVSFMLSGPATANNVRASIFENTDGDGNEHFYHNCNNTSGNTWTCSLNSGADPAALLPAVQLEVAAAQ